ncbi:MAG TPA: hypothetical protein PKD64_03580 [Pirellulaceae bacterium]|nr:hypothetical protein [Pirellulaceae bacterium]HMO91252.1 hypothetical protein [Pirellulaceae bacterium]HMP68564.1 hypothetical protein [Pirellulaceae bacterium]
MNSSEPSESESMYERFRRSARIDADNWRDPQHDLEAIQLATSAERQQIEQFLLGQGIRHFIDVEALALLDTPQARHALLRAFRNGKTEIRAAVARVAPHLIAEDEQATELLDRIAVCDAYEGLSLTLTQIESMHPPDVIRAMLQRIVRDPGVVAVHFAAMLLYLHGLATEPFEWDQRPFFLRFNPGDDTDRRDAIQELCRKIGVSETDYLREWPAS